MEAHSHLISRYHERYHEAIRMKPGPRHGNRVRATKFVKGVLVSDSYWVGDPIEETRQQYANIRISLKILEFKAAGEVCPFDVLLLAFRCYGAFYDAGQRLRDLQVAA